MIVVPHTAKHLAVTMHVHPALACSFRVCPSLAPALTTGHDALQVYMTKDGRISMAGLNRCAVRRQIRDADVLVLSRIDCHAVHGMFTFS